MLVYKLKQFTKPFYARLIRIWVFLCLPFVSQKISISPDEAKQQLEKISPDSHGKVDANNQITPTYDLHIIIPCYNVEKYIRACLTSVFTQKTQFSYFVTIINDGSTDNTLRHIEQFIHTLPAAQQQQVELINQPNKGFSGARNTGLAHIQGKYIMFVDSDDLLTSNAVEDLLSAAFYNKANIAEGSYHIINTENKILSDHPVRERFFGQPWAKIFKAECFKELKFPEGYFFEDSIVGCCLFSKYSKINVNAFVYQYRQNPSGITANHQKIKKSIDVFYLFPYLWEWMNQRNLFTNPLNLKIVFTQAALAYARTSLLGKEVIENGFCVLASAIKSLSIPQNLKTLSWKERKMLTAFYTNDFGKWKFLSTYWRFL